MSSDHLPGSNVQVNECSNLKSPDFGFCYPVCTFKLYHKASPITTITGLSLREQGTMISFPGFLSYYCPEKEMATHSSILVWEIPWTEEPGGFMGSQSQTGLRRLKQNSCPDAAMEQNTEQP